MRKLIKQGLAEQTENLVINKTSTNKGQYQSNIWQVPWYKGQCQSKIGIRTG